MNSSHHSTKDHPMHTCHVPPTLADRSAELARLRFLSHKVSMVHGASHPAMTELATVITTLAETPAASIPASARDALQRLTMNYIPWPNACGSVRGLFEGLQQLPDVPSGDQQAQA